MDNAVPASRFSKRTAVIIVAFIVLISFNAVAFAEVGDSKKQVEQKYGSYSFLQDITGCLWTRENWFGWPGGKPAIKAYGYQILSKEQKMTVWVSYNKRNMVEKETVILDGSIKIRDFSDYFPELYQRIAPEDSAFIVRAYPGDQLVVFFHSKEGKGRSVRFTMGDSHDKTRINMHSKIHSFEITEASTCIDGSKNCNLQDGAAGGVLDENWTRTGNFFRPELFYSEGLVRREKTDLIVIHHTGIENMSVADIQEMHLKNGWAGIGYHKVIFADGSVKNGRPEDMVGAHAKGANQNSIGIVLIGNFENSRPTDAQMDALIGLTLDLMKKYDVPLNNVVPHKAVTEGTVCPGTLFSWEEFIGKLRSELRHSLFEK